MTRTAVFFTTHVINKRVTAHFCKLRDELPEGYQLTLFYDEAHLSERAARNLAGDALLPHKGNDWQRFKRPGRLSSAKIPGNEEALMFSALDRLPGYDWYWYIEYDVAFSGNWGKFFSATEQADADLLAVNMIRRGAIPNWPLWRSLEIPPGLEVAHSGWVRAHFAIARISRRLPEVLIPVYKQGWAGNSEGLLATLAEQHGLRIEDIGGDGEFVKTGNTNRFYRSTPANDSLGPGTFVFRPAMEKPGDDPDMLWHPVKKASRNDWDRRDNLLFRLIDLVRSKLHG